jgi:hypothetical protein
VVGIVDALDFVAIGPSTACPQYLPDHNDDIRATNYAALEHHGEQFAIRTKALEEFQIVALDKPVLVEGFHVAVVNV